MAQMDHTYIPSLTYLLISRTFSPYPETSKKKGENHGPSKLCMLFSSRKVFSPSDF